MLPVNKYEKKQMEQIQRNGIERPRMKGFIRVLDEDEGGLKLLNINAISVVEPADDDEVLIWLVDRSDPIRVGEKFNTIAGWIWNATEG